MQFFLLGLLLTSSLYAQVSLDNDREGKSFYATGKFIRSEARVLKKVRSDDLIVSFKNILSKTDERKLCAFDINNELKDLNSEIKPRDFKGILLHLRNKNKIDDVALKILLNAHEVESTSLSLPKTEEELWRSSDEKKTSKVLEKIEDFKSRLEKGCLDEAYREFYADSLKIDKKLKGLHLEYYFVEAYRQKKIDLKTYKLLEKARVNNLEFSLDLKSYYKKIKSLRTQYPLRDSTEKSNYVTQKIKKKALSHRQSLYENFSDLQIILMADVIKKLRSRLDSPKIEILVYGDQQDVQEVLSLEPMERFRFAIKVLRKEMAHLSINTYFKGRSPSYLDLMTAAYEIGIIPAEELDEVASLEEIWNPKKTFWEKARVWVHTFGSAAAIIIPPPYGFIPSLAIVVIEATVGKKETVSMDGSLF